MDWTDRFGWRRLICTAALCVAGLTFAAPTPEDPFRPDITYADGTVGDYYANLAEFTWAATPGQTFTLGYQGCDASMCHMPQELTFSITADGKVVEGALPAPVAAAVTEPMPEASSVPAEPQSGVERSKAGFITPEKFIVFLRGEQSAKPEVNASTDSHGQPAEMEVNTSSDQQEQPAEMEVNTSSDQQEQPAEMDVSFLDDPQAWVAANGVWLLILVVFVGGLLLNLTPCVLPMIPINLAIIGAGAAGGSRLRGALRGGAYGLGIALTYGILVIIPILTGTAFGAIQSAWWFNVIIAVVFILLALALFDVFMIDFTRFAGPGSGKKGTIAAFVAGAISAVLAGACVAPVLLAVLLLTADGVATGSWLMLSLPFVLGLGMAAPWPIAGAGLSFLPRPGAWMMWVKKGFGVVVLLFAAYYGWVAYRSFIPVETLDGSNLAAIEAAIAEGKVVNLDGADLPAIEAAIATARAQGKPVFIDFWGTACKACDEMERDTFPDPAVQAELERFAFLKVRMDLSDSGIRPTKERFKIIGLPTYVVIE